MEMGAHTFPLLPFPIRLASILRPQSECLKSSNALLQGGQSTAASVKVPPPLLAPATAALSMTGACLP